MAHSGWKDKTKRKTLIGRLLPILANADHVFIMVLESSYLPSLEYQANLLAAGCKGAKARSTTPRRMDQPSAMSVPFRMMTLVMNEEFTEVLMGHVEDQGYIAMACPTIFP